MPSGYANTNALHAAVAARTLATLGVKAAVISPGSRSTPLTHALVNEPAIDCTPVLDERTAAFFALGLAKTTGAPVALLCTSGTAAANWLPAVIEARLSGTPLLLLSADRPHEMRECASGQTVDQTKLFGAHAVWSAEVACPEPGYETTLPHWRRTFAHAVERAREARGPVHLNLPFRDPLAPHEAQPGFAAPDDFNLAKYCEIKRPLPLRAQDDTIADISFWTKYNVPKDTHERGLIVVGACSVPAVDADVWAAGVLGLARFTGYPVLTDSLAPLRGAPGADERVITTYDLLLRDESNASDLAPSVIIRIGQPPTSKTLRKRLAQWDVPTLVISPTGDNLDPLHRRSSTLRTSPERWATEPFAGHGALTAYAARWADLDASAGLDLADSLASEPELREPRLVGALAAHLPPGTPLFVANSMPVRDTETFLPRGSNAHPVYHNRGANGIDGTLGTALGAATGLDRHTVLLTGDLSLLHDTNALLLASRLRTTLTVLLVNNDGGGIFNHLAVAKHPDFEEFWATPQPVKFAKLAAAYAGVTYTAVADLKSLERELSRAPETPGVRILEVRTDRADDAAWRKSLYARLGGG